MGHVSGIDSLIRVKEEFLGFLSDKVIKCLGDKEGDHEMMRQVLQRLAVTGFAQLRVVKRSSTIIGLASEVSDTNCESGIVPSKQSMRLTIAKQLSQIWR